MESIEAKSKKEKRQPNFRELADIEVLRKIGLHSMRRTFITAMAERNVPLPVTMEMVGHMSPKMTERYTRISSNAQRQAVELQDPPAGPSQKVQQESSAVTEEKVYRV